MRKFCNCFLFLGFLLYCGVGKAQEGADSTRVSLVPSFQKPQPWSGIKGVPANVKISVRQAFKKESLPWVGAVTATSALLIWQDQAITDGLHKWLNQLGFSAQTRYVVPLKVGDTKVLKLPRNATAAFYQLGQGGTSMLVAGGLLLYGKLKQDNRALQTASDLTQTFISSALFTQVIKRTTGRQSPFVATRPGGVWHPFPSFKAYQTNTPNYDAFPSGHLTTFTATAVVLASNYPEKKWIVPVAIGLGTLMSTTMIHTGVHWAGDYPLAIALGYLSGKAAVWQHHPKQPKRLRTGFE